MLNCLFKLYHTFSNSSNLTFICNGQQSGFKAEMRGHGGRVVTLSPPTSEAGVRFTALPQVAVGRQFTVQNLDQLYVLVSPALPTTCRDMTCTVLKAM